MGGDERWVLAGRGCSGADDAPVLSGLDELGALLVGGGVARGCSILEPLWPATAGDFFFFGCFLAAGEARARAFPGFVAGRETGARETAMAGLGAGGANATDRAATGRDGAGPVGRDDVAASWAAEGISAEPSPSARGACVGADADSGWDGADGAPKEFSTIGVVTVGGTAGTEAKTRLVASARALWADVSSAW
ncbi:hypothetical protein PF011_g18544 [Phytophthora fragariae]|uniref:Uncharacterized protein n=1 Tax=Phytophthora fragariae TaxID=53985 RepID=A0A6A3J8E2_9STRA|nr:hypothetical protein PF011_g18544 [Phytophthora fragariae]